MLLKDSVLTSRACRKTNTDTEQAGDVTPAMYCHSLGHTDKYSKNRSHGSKQSETSASIALRPHAALSVGLHTSRLKIATPIFPIRRQHWLHAVSITSRWTTGTKAIAKRAQSFSSPTKDKVLYVMMTSV